MGNVVLNRNGGTGSNGGVTNNPTFSMTMPSVINWFTNQEDNKIDKGYNAEGLILYISEGLCDDRDEDISFE